MQVRTAAILPGDGLDKLENGKISYIQRKWNLRIFQAAVYSLTVIVTSL
jgi:hypothetical protein